MNALIVLISTFTSICEDILPIQHFAMYLKDLLAKEMQFKNFLPILAITCPVIPLRPGTVRSTDNNLAGTVALYSCENAAR